MNMHLRLIVCAAALLVCSAPSKAEPVCDVDDAKKRVITSFLCGQMAQAAENRFSGPDCMIEAARKRATGSAAQIQLYRVCGDPEFAERLKTAGLKAVKLVETLSACAGGRVDYRKVMDEALSQVEKTAGAEECTPVRKTAASERREELERTVAQADDNVFYAKFFEKLGIRVDDAGNIHDK
jgi:hypothetical protein